MKKLFILFCLFSLSFSSIAGTGLLLDRATGLEESPQPRSVVKMNLSSLALLTFSFQAEHAFHKRMSAALGFYKITPIKIPSALGVGDFISARFSGYGITPEFRYFPGNKKKDALNGFYIAPYFRYSRYTLKGSYSDKYTGFNGGLTGITTAYGGGVMLGSQWLIGKHFSIDLFIAGLHVGKRKYKFEIQNDGIGVLTSGERQDIVNGALFLFDEYADINIDVYDDKLALKFGTGHLGDYVDFIL